MTEPRFLIASGRLALPLATSALLTLTAGCSPRMDLGRDTAAICTPGQDQTCNDDPQASAIWGACKADGTCDCAAGYAIDQSSGRCAPTAAQPGVCTPGSDQTCNDNPSVSALWGTCKADGSCSCATGFVIKASSGRCTPTAAQPSGCTPGSDQTCNDDPSVSTLWGTCKADGSCDCAAGFVIKASSGRCTPAPLSASYLLWQGLFASNGVGAALEVVADGTVNLWAGTTALQPHQTQDWSTQLQLPASDAAQLFTLLSQVDFSKLPHPGTETDCGNKLHLELDGQTSPINVGYKNANNLRPELDAVYQWLTQHLASSTAIRLPHGYVCGSGSSPVGNYCAKPADCGTGYTCHQEHLGSGWVPDGYCVVAQADGSPASCNNNDQNCPAGALCAPMPAATIPGVCMRACNSDTDCRSGYACDFVSLFPDEPQSPKSSGKVCWTKDYQTPPSP